MIAIIDEYPIVRSGIQNILKEHFGISRILESNSITSFHDDFEKEIPEMIILSISRQNGNQNIQTIDFIKEFYPKSRIILYDESVDTATVRKYFQSGISGYLCKTGVLTELITCIEKTLRGEPFISSDLLYAILKDRPVATKNAGQKPQSLLTTREYEIATLLINGKKTSEIAQNLQRKATTISTIKANIFKKMGVTNIVTLRDVMAG